MAHLAHPVGQIVHTVERAPHVGPLGAQRVDRARRCPGLLGFSDLAVHAIELAQHVHAQRSSITAGELWQRWHVRQPALSSGHTHASLRWGTAFDESLAGRMRALLVDEPDVTERRMFGGLAFMIAGNMAVVASSQGGLMVKVPAADTADLIASTPAHPAEMRGRPMRGWLRVDSVDLATDAELAPWVHRGVTAVRTPEFQVGMVGMVGMGRVELPTSAERNCRAGGSVGS